MAKKIKALINVLCEAIGLYFNNFDKFIKYMSFPVLGQIVGLCVIFLTTYVYAKNLPNLISKYPNFDNFNTLTLISIIIILPGLIIFCKAFWDYLVAYGSVNSMVNALLKSGKLYDFEAHKELVDKRAVKFIGLWFLFGIFSIIAVIPLFWIICGVLTIYFVLTFQAFTYCPELTPLGYVKKSFSLIKGNFAKTFILFSAIGFITYFVIPQIFLKTSNILNLSNFLANSILPFAALLPQVNLEQLGLPVITHKELALFIVNTIFVQIIIQYTLPLRSILWALWYRELGGEIDYNISYVKTKHTKHNKRPSEKLMEASNKKFKKSKLDSNILKRAMEKDED